MFYTMIGGVGRREEAGSGQIDISLDMTIAREDLKSKHGQLWVTQKEQLCFCGKIWLVLRKTGQHIEGHPSSHPKVEY